MSYFEWVQDRYGYFWEESEVNARLEKKMHEAFHDVLRTSKKYNVDMRTGAYIVAIDPRRDRHARPRHCTREIPRDSRSHGSTD